MRKLVISQNRPTGWIGFASKAQPATKGFFSLIITPEKIHWKLNWLAANTRPDISIYTLDLAKKQKKATLKDVRDMNRVLKRVQ